MQILINPALQAVSFATPFYQDNAGLLASITHCSSCVSAHHVFLYTMCYTTIHMRADP